MRALADAIVRGVIPPGLRLDDRDLARQFDVLRAPVREALGARCGFGLTERRPTRGVVTAMLASERLADMFEVIAEPEAATSRFAAVDVTAAKRRRLAAVHDASRLAVQAGDSEDYEAVNRQFHETLYGGAHKIYLRQLTLAVRNRLMPFRHAQFSLCDRLACSRAEHDRLVPSGMRGEAEAAMRAMRAHVVTEGEASAEYVPRKPIALP